MFVGKILAIRYYHFQLYSIPCVWQIGKQINLQKKNKKKKERVTSSSSRYSYKFRQWWKLGEVPRGYVRFTYKWEAHLRKAERIFLPITHTTFALLDFFFLSKNSFLFVAMSYYERCARPYILLFWNFFFFIFFLFSCQKMCNTFCFIFDPLPFY